MSDIPIHVSPPYSEGARDDALFHYTTAKGLIGILSTGQIWSTAYYCANDESELATGKGVLSPLFRIRTFELIKQNDPRVLTFARRGVDVLEYAAQFENRIASNALSMLCAYITCFCKPTGEEDFRHGLLSQWRGYGADGGYALHFSRKKLLAAVANIGPGDYLDYDLLDVHYHLENPLKAEVLRHGDAFVQAYELYLDELADPLVFKKKTMRNPIASLPGGSLEAFLNYLVHTKNKHFAEERECRLSLVQAASVPAAVAVGSLPVSYYDRGGLPVPYNQTPRARFNLLDCVEWIVIGPGPRMGARFRSVRQLVSQHAEHIEVRPSHIPFTRL